MSILEKKLQILENKINFIERESLGKNIITEMKKIGIEKLPYSYSALEKFIDSKTMNIHYNKHYKGYVEKLNKLISKKEGKDMDLEDIVKSISKFEKKVRNNAGGAFNHALFWKMLSPKKQKPSEELLDVLKKNFGSFEKFKKDFEEVSQDNFGSGWSWLVLTKTDKLKVMSTPNQDNPLMNIIDKGGYPILGLDLWEHAYYLKYQNKKDDYIKNFWNCVNWDFVDSLYKTKIKKKLIESINLKNLLIEQLNEDDDGGSSKNVVSDSNNKFNTKKFRELILNQYPACSPSEFKEYDLNVHRDNPCVGKIDTGLCQTTLGIIGGNYSVNQFGGLGDWSTINWFDTNSKVHEEIVRIFNQNNPTNIKLDEWVSENILDLVGNDGKYTSKLSSQVLTQTGGTLFKGNQIEKIAVKILESKYPGIIISKFCDGDLRDRLKGQDLVAEFKGKIKHIQVKPFYGTLKKVESSSEGVFYEIGNYFELSKYSPDNVQMIGFIDVDTQKYVFFDLLPGQYSSVPNPSGYGPKFLLRFKNEPKFTSDKLKIQQVDSLSKLPKEERIKVLTSQIKDYENKLQNLRKRLEQEGGDSLTEQINRLESKIFLLEKLKKSI